MMLFSFEDRKAIHHSVRVLALAAATGKPQNRKAAKLIAGIEETLSTAGPAREEGGKGTATRVRTATRAHLTVKPEEAEKEKAVLTGIAGRAAERLLDLREKGEASDLPALTPRIHQAPHLGVWTFTQSLVTVKCLAETPPTQGEDDILHLGSFTYGGPGVLAPYYHEFDTSETHQPSLALVSVPVLLGRHNYRATHLVSEEDMLPDGAAKAVAIGVTLLLDLLIELGILAAKGAVKGWMMSQRPDEITEDDWEKIVDEVLDAMGEVARDGADDLLGLLARWLSDALGPEVFPQMTSEATIEWTPPGVPVVTGIRVIGSTTARGLPPAFAGPGTSIVPDVRLHRGGGGDYVHAFAFTVSGRGPG